MTAADFRPIGPLEPVVTTTPSGVMVFDWRRLRAEDLPFAKDGKGWARGVSREPERVDAVLAHQWGSAVGVTPENRHRYGEPLALAMRALETKYHGSAGVTRGGVPVVVLAHPAERHTHHAGPANGRSLGAACMGRFPLAEQARDARRHGPATTDALRLAWEHLLALLSLEVLAAGAGRPALFLTHRQAVSDPRPRAARSSDPGEWLVKAACEAAEQGRLRLRFAPDETMGEHGERWPAAWRRHLPRQQTLVSAPAAFATPAARDYDGPLAVDAADRPPSPE